MADLPLRPPADQVYRIGDPVIDATPVRAHVNALIASGMDDRRIAELSGRVTTGFIDLLLRGFCTQVSVANARSVLAIPVPGDPSPETPAAYI
jgi:hypothetical protein